MDYPFYLMPLVKLPDELLAEVKGLLDESNTAAHPHFTSKERNPNTFRLHDPNNEKVVDLITTFLDPYIPKAKLYWKEFNLIKPGGTVGEHSDLAYAGYNREKGTPQEVLLTHKIHIHLGGEAELKFRRSKYEPQTVHKAVVGQCYWYNNYVLHESHNPGTENRLALILIYHDSDWELRFKLFNEKGFLYQRSYQL